MKTYPFSALFSRMKYITRWSLMRSTRAESLSEHTADTAMLAHTLCLIGKSCTGTGAALRPEVVATAALYHDAPEILTGDMPTPIKYYNPDIKTAYKEVERIAGNRLLDMLPAELRSSYTHYVLEDDAELEPFVKAADKLSAHIKCLEEQKAGNTEFDSASQQTLDALRAMNRPELEWFLDNCLQAFTLNLDQL